MNTNQTIDSDAHIVESTILPDFQKSIHEERLKHGRSSIDRADHTLGGKIGKYEADLATRLIDMDADHIDIAVLFPTSGLSLGYVRDPGMAMDLCRAYNECLSKICESKMGRLKAIALLAPQNVPASVNELRRAVRELGAVGGVLPTTGHKHMFGSEEFFPLYEAAEELDCPLTVHANAVGGDALGGDRFSRLIGMHTVGHPFEQMLQLTSMVLGGVFDRFPSLRVGYMEAGCGWVPYLMDRLDEEIEVLGVQAPAVRGLPSASIRSGRLFFTCESEDKNIAYFVDRVNENALLYASDYPHFDWKTDTVSTLMERRDLSSGLKRKLLTENAKLFYSL